MLLFALVRLCVFLTGLCAGLAVSGELWSAASSLTKDLAKYTKPEQFEHIALLHSASRGMTASHLALWQGRQTVSARELFCGTDCTRAFTLRSFDPVLKRRVLTPVAAVPWPSASEATRHITLQNGSTVDLASAPSAPFILHLGGRNAVDTVAHDWVRSGTERKLVLDVIDTKHVTSDYGRVNKTVVEEWVRKRRTLKEALSASAELEVLAVLVSLGKRVKDPDGVSRLLEEVIRDDWTCVVSATGDRLSWGLSPVLAYFLSQ